MEKILCRPLVYGYFVVVKHLLRVARETEKRGFSPDALIPSGREVQSQGQSQPFQFVYTEFTPAAISISDNRHLYFLCLEQNRLGQHLTLL